MRERYLRHRLPWIAIDDTDLRPQGDPETAVLLYGSGTLIGLHIKGLSGHVMLGIREDDDGHPVSCAITNEIQIDTLTREPSQSNPHRAKFYDGDGVSDDGA